MSLLSACRRSSAAIGTGVMVSLASLISALACKCWNSQRSEAAFSRVDFPPPKFPQERRRIASCRKRQVEPRQQKPKLRGADLEYGLWWVPPEHAQTLQFVERNGGFAIAREQIVDDLDWLLRRGLPCVELSLTIDRRGAVTSSTIRTQPASKACRPCLCHVLQVRCSPEAFIRSSWLFQN